MQIVAEGRHNGRYELKVTGYDRCKNGASMFLTVIINAAPVARAAMF